VCELDVGLVARAVLRVAAEKAERDPGRDEPGDDDAEQKQRRKLEPERAQHAPVASLCLYGGVPSGGDLVAHAPNGDDRRGLAELAPQLAHVDVDGAGVAGEG